MLPLLLLEDDERLGMVTRDVLSMNWQVTWVQSIADARSQALASTYAVIIADRRLPDGDGTELITYLRSRGDHTPVLILTAAGELHDKVSGLDAGANDYLVKPFEFEELEARLRALTRDFLADDDVYIGSWNCDFTHHTVESPYSGRIQLTERESRLLEVLATHPDSIFTRDELLAAVFDHSEGVSTVDTYVHYLRKKLDRDIIQTVRGVGYRIGTPA